MYFTFQSLCSLLSVTIKELFNYELFTNMEPVRRKYYELHFSRPYSAVFEAMISVDLSDRKEYITQVQITVGWF